jgi:hypothetical protein
MMGRCSSITEKLKSDARGLVMEGNLPLQLVFDDGDGVAAASACRATRSWRSPTWAGASRTRRTRTSSAT